jgi:hypothetical protein
MLYSMVATIFETLLDAAHEEAKAIERQRHYIAATHQAATS